MDKLNERYFPEKEEALNKINFVCKAFSRVWWYYEEEVELYEEIKEESLNPKKHPHYSGVLVPKNFIENRGRNLDIDETNVIVDQQPTNKSYPFYTYITLSDLLDVDQLVEILNKEQVNGKSNNKS